MARRVVAPDGVRWTVRRRWVHAPVRPRWRGTRDADAFSFADLGGGLGDSGVLGAIAAIIAIIVLAAFIAFVLLPLAVLLLEVLLFLLLAGIGLFGRVALRRPWRIEARSSDGRRTVREVSGWRDSRDAIAQLAADVERGIV
ncbi:hypothetical protein [Baekduia sp. Peel2402]|uniref:hypothetical protein n=1 Tax=Baekduia sp. Peel2402 TaxID=3458296 RepID=UPI00403ECF95